MDYTKESEKYVKKTRSGYLFLGFPSFYKDYYSKNVKDPLPSKVASTIFSLFFKKLYYKIIVDKYKFKLPVLGDLFFVSETSKAGISQFINWPKTTEKGKIVREINIGLNGRKPFFKHERAEKVKHNRFYQLVPLVGKRKDYLEGARGLWRHINDLLKDPTAKPYRANL